MKTLKIVITFFLFNIFSLNAQDLTNWQVGINVNPFLFSKLNTVSYLKKEKQDLPNGFGFGITIEKNWNERWGFKTGFESTYQNIKYFVDDNSEDNTQMSTKFKYYKIPLTVQYYIPIKEKWFLTLNQGMQLSILKYFKTVFQNNTQRITYSTDYVEKIFFNKPEYNYISYTNFNGIYHSNNLIGLIGSIGLKSFFSEHLSISSNLRYEYDLTDPDKTPYFQDFDSNIHNFRIGLEIGLQYNFAINDRFNKRRIKI